MPTYFFNTYGDAEFVDKNGTELPDDARAYRDAIRLAGTMMKENPELLFGGKPFRTEVKSEAGETLFTIVTLTQAGIVSQTA